MEAGFGSWISLHLGNQPQASQKLLAERREQWLLMSLHERFVRELQLIL